MGEKCSVVVVVVAYGAEQLLEACLSPLTADLRVVVVDNAGRDECRAVCWKHGAEYVNAKRNLGFAGGVNIALALLPRGTDVLLLNPDARLTVADVDVLAQRLRAGGRLAGVAPAQSHPDSGEEQRVVWPFPSPRRRWFEAFGLGRLVSSQDFLVGSALLLSGAAIADVGPLDERYFLYCEETDWQRRAAEKGWAVRLVPEVTALHVGAATSSDPTLREAYFHAAHELYVRKWFGSRGWTSYRAAALVGDGLRSLTGGQRARLARARLTVYGRGPLAHRERVLAGPRT